MGNDADQRHQSVIYRRELRQMLSDILSFEDVVLVFATKIRHCIRPEPRVLDKIHAFLVDHLLYPARQTIAQLIRQHTLNYRQQVIEIITPVFAHIKHFIIL
jgi:hypothetical protein